MCIIENIIKISIMWGLRKSFWGGWGNLWDIYVSYGGLGYIFKKKLCRFKKFEFLWKVFLIFIDLCMSIMSLYF